MQDFQGKINKHISILIPKVSNFPETLPNNVTGVKPLCHLKPVSSYLEKKVPPNNNAQCNLQIKQPIFFPCHQGHFTRETVVFAE